MGLDDIQAQAQMEYTNGAFQDLLTNSDSVEYQKTLKATEAKSTDLQVDKL